MYFTLPCECTVMRFRVSFRYRLRADEVRTEVAVYLEENDTKIPRKST